jgi:hypothetical protein
MMAILFRMYKFAGWESYHRVEDGEHPLASAQSDPESGAPPTDSFSPKKKNM